MPSFPDLAEPLRSERVALRFMAERDIPEILIAHQDDPALFERMGLERPPSGAELGRRAETEPEDRATGTAAAFTLLAPDDDTCRGQLDVHHVDWDHLHAEAGVWVAPQFRGRGMAPDALRLVAGWLFDVCGLLRLGLMTEPNNAAMIAAARSAGLGEEGILRQYVRERGRRLDVAVLSLLPADLARP